MARITLRNGRVQPVWAGHPWVFAQAVANVDGAPAPGDAVEVLDPKGKRLGRGFWSPSSAIVVRLVTRDPDEALDDAALIRRVERAFERRRRLGLPGSDGDGYRLIHAEGDDLPGLIVDLYGDVATVQLLTVGMKRREDILFGAIARVANVRTVIEMPGGKSQAQEGIEATRRVVRGPDRDHLRFAERGLKYEIDLGTSQKTGYYFDQRENRARVEQLASGRRVLDLYSYVGGFSLGAARGGASSVTAYDSNGGVIAAAVANAERNGLRGRIDFVQGDVRRVLSNLAQAEERYDLVVVDPPRLAPSVKHLAKAKTAYRKLNARAMSLVEPGGILVTCSCSAAMRPEPFVRLLAMAARDANRYVTVLHEGQQGPDHPVSAAFPEGRYLKAVFLEVHR